jgi:3-deoxy-manno-octulosonate cytidylyltransferase (CMP-KDO synthetase)
MRKAIIFIPCRMGSKRFPGKPLAMVGDKPLVCHTYDYAVKSGLSSIIITPDVEIREELEERYPDVSVAMTYRNAKNGSERCGLMCEILCHEGFTDEDIIINVQGDMVSFDSSVIQEIVSVLSHTTYEYCSVAVDPYCLPNYSQFLSDENKVKCTVTGAGMIGLARACQFSRTWIRESLNYLHVGIYGFTVRALNRYCGWKQTENEKKHSLEQFRIIDNKYELAMVLTAIPSITVDCPEDAILARIHTTDVQKRAGILI